MEPNEPTVHGKTRVEFNKTADAFDWALAYYRLENELNALVTRLDSALRNVRMLATRIQRRGYREGEADHLLRFCEKAGVTGSVLREVPDEQSE